MLAFLSWLISAIVFVTAVCVVLWILRAEYEIWINNRRK